MSEEKLRAKQFKKKPAIPAEPARVSFSKSKSTKSEDPIHVLIQQFQRFLHLPDPMLIYAVMGAVAANCIIGDEPVWLMVVGASGSGKTAVLKSLRDLDKVELVSAIESTAGLLSAVKAKDRAKDATGGLLAKIGAQGCLVWYEFTSILELPKEKLKGMLAALREIYDGHWGRQVGTDGGRTVNWDGKAFVFAAVTNAIDSAHEFSSKMGERFVFYRLPYSDGWSESFKALGAAEDEVDMYEELAGNVAGFAAAMGLEWGTIKARVLTTGEKNRIIAFGQLGARARSGVNRDFHQRDIIDVPASELPMRITKALRKMYLGMEIIGVDEDDRWAVVKKIAMDSMPLSRRTVIEALLRPGNEEMSVQMVGEVMQCSLTTVRRTLEDLEAHGVVSRSGENGVFWRLSAWSREKLADGKSEKVSRSI